jgi:hypothetical protein
MVTAIPNDIRTMGPLKPMRFEAHVEDCVIAEGEVPRSVSRPVRTQPSPHVLPPCRKGTLPDRALGPLHGEHL